MNRKYSSKRRYKKRSYKRRTYKRRYYKRRYYKPIKKPEIHIIETGTSVPFNNSTFGMGLFNNLTVISSNTTGIEDEIVYKINNKSIDGSKVRLKYLYIKGYIKVGASSAEEADDFNCKLMVFRWKRNIINSNISWDKLLNGVNTSDNDPTGWTETERLNMMYNYDWKNDIKVNFYKRVKNLYRKYDDANNVIPFKIRVPLYDCVMTCDSYFNNSSQYSSYANPSTNGLYFTFLSNKFDANTTITYKAKLYYTDY